MTEGEARQITKSKNKRKATDLATTIEMNTKHKIARKERHAEDGAGGMKKKKSPVTRAALMQQLSEAGMQYHSRATLAELQSAVDQMLAGATNPIGAAAPAAPARQLQQQLQRHLQQQLQQQLQHAPTAAPTSAPTPALTLYEQEGRERIVRNKGVLQELRIQQAKLAL